MSCDNTEEDKVRKALTLLSKRVPSVSVKLNSLRGRRLNLELTVEGSSPSKPLNELTRVLESVTGAPYRILRVSREVDGGFNVEAVKLDFLQDVKTAKRRVESVVKERMREFKRVGRDEKETFKELCFCILTANFTAEGGIKIQKALGDELLRLSESGLAGKLAALGHRYPKARAKYIVEARRLYGTLRDTLNGFKSVREAREWLVKNVKGLGYKEASHFLRNVGFSNVAIIDRHILKFLADKGLIEVLPRRLDRRSYLKLERLLSLIFCEMKVPLGELDLYLWYLVTGKILK